MQPQVFTGYIHVHRRMLGWGGRGGRGQRKKEKDRWRPTDYQVLVATATDSSCMHAGAEKHDRRGRVEGVRETRKDGGPGPPDTCHSRTGLVDTFRCTARRCGVGWWGVGGGGGGLGKER